MPINIAIEDQASEKLHFWLRAETKLFERRTPLLPQDARQLIALGHRVTVEESDDRCASDTEYLNNGCEMASSGSWMDAPEDAIILGLKELPRSDAPLRHRHVMFGHCFKNQENAATLLSRFSENGKLWDLEFLVDDTGKRVAAFGRSAGFIGMATGLKQWCHSTLTKQTLGQLQYYTTTESLLREVTDDLTLVREETSLVPKIMVMGALGRSGGGAVEFAKMVGIPSANIVTWNEKDSQTRGASLQSIILECDIFVNCINLNGPISPFLTESSLKIPRNLTVVVDVSCDLQNPHNPLPIYTKKTNFRKPSQRIAHGPILDVVAIENLTSLAPLESSREFSMDLLPHLKVCGKSPVWERVDALFAEKMAALHLDGAHSSSS